MNDLCQLRHFVALAEHQHFARAVAAVHLSQPALSPSIQTLESQLDCTLVDRHSRGVSLTAHGRLVLEHACRLLDSAIELFVADIRELQDAAQLRIEPLRVHQGVLFCRPAHPLLQRRNLHLRDLLDFPLADTQLPQVIERSLGQASGRAQTLSVECDNFLVLKRLVAGSDVLSMAPWDVIAEEVRSGQLCLLPMQAEGLHQHSAYGLVSRAGHSLSPAAQAMVTAIRQVDEQTPRAKHAAD